MNNREVKFFKGVYDIFGETTTILLSKFYIGLVHDLKMFGLLLSTPFKFVQFFKEAWKENGENMKKGRE
ncbi:MAG: hypothetical protein NC548_42535 [Lachnospiraceae bacterium]|nr:hypothetical protein [Lachnospiraceae bacterium]